MEGRREGGRHHARSAGAQGHRLVDADALFFLSELDFRFAQGTVAWAGALFHPGYDARHIQAKLVTRDPDPLPIEQVFPFDLLLPVPLPVPVGGAFPFFIPLRSATVGDRLRPDIGAVPGAVGVLVGFPTRNSCGDHVLDRCSRVAAELGPAKV
jgi:hypothetical protein